jgi:hypothetical protein
MLKKIECLFIQQKMEHRWNLLFVFLPFCPTNPCRKAEHKNAAPKNGTHPLINIVLQKYQKPGLQGHWHEKSVSNKHMADALSLQYERYHFKIFWSFL